MLINSASTDPTQVFPAIQQLIEKQSVRPISPTLIIGIGSAGYAVLSGLKKQVLDDNSGQLPDTLQLLWLGYPEHAQVEAGAVELDSHEQILLTPNVEMANRTIAQNRERYAYLDWWFTDQRNNRRNRGNGRFSLFWLLYFENQAQKLSDSLKYINSKLGGKAETRYRVFFVTDLFEPVSAILIDLAHLVQQALPPEKTKFRIPILLLNKSETTSDEQKAGIVASFRELERFMSGREQHLDVGGFGKSILTPNFLFDHFMVFDKPQAQKYLPDLMLALIQPGIAEKFNEALVNRSGTEDAGQFLFSNAAIFTYFLPISEIRRTCAAKLLQDELFSGSSGGHPGQFPPVSSSISRQDDFASFAKSFLRDDHHEFGASAFPLDVLAHASERKWVSPSVQQADLPDLIEMLQHRLAAYLNQVMYTERSSLAFVRPYGVLGWVQEFLKALRTVLREADFFLNQQRGNIVALDLARKTKDLQRVLDEQHWMGEIERWQGILGSVQSLTRDNLKYAQENLKLSVQNTAARQSLFSKNMDGMETGDVSHSYYKNFIDQGQGIRARSEIRRRTGWFWKVEKDPAKTRLYWIVFGPLDNLENWKSALHNYLPDDIQKAFSRLVALSDVYTRQIGQDETVISLLRERRSSEIVSPFASPYFLLEMLPVPNRTRVRDQYLAGADQAQLIEWTSQNRQVELSQQTIRINDPIRLIHLVVDRNLPKGALRFLNDNQDKYHRDASLHIFIEEQNAVRFEREYGITQMLHPRMVRLMGDLQAFKIFLRCILYGWIREEFDGSHKIWCINTPGILTPIWLVDGNFRPSSLEAALYMALIYIPWVSMNSAHDLYNQGRGKYRQTLDYLSSACEAHQKIYSQKDAQNKQTLIDHYQKQIEDWLNSPDEFLYSLGLALKGMFDREAV